MCNWLKVKWILFWMQYHAFRAVATNNAYSCGNHSTKLDSLVRKFNIITELEGVGENAPCEMIESESDFNDKRWLTSVFWKVGLYVRHVELHWNKVKNFTDAGNRKAR